MQAVARFAFRENQFAGTEQFAHRAGGEILQLGRGKGSQQRRAGENRSEIDSWRSHGTILSIERLSSLHLYLECGVMEDMNPLVNAVDFNQRPFIAIWEVTQACDLACVHCRASAQPERPPLELSTDEGKQLIDQIAALEVPVFVLTGGDPIKRPDLFELIGHARKVGVRVSLTPSATPLLTREIVL